MYMQQSIVKCESGLYNRQATYFIQKANEFKSSIWVEVEGRKINAKSLLGVLSRARASASLLRAPMRKKQSRH